MKKKILISHMPLEKNKRQKTYLGVTILHRHMCHHLATLEHQHSYHTQPPHAGKKEREAAQQCVSATNHRNL